MRNKDKLFALDALIAAADDMNEALQLDDDDFIDTSLTDKEIADQIKAAAKLIYWTDEQAQENGDNKADDRGLLEVDTWNVLKQLGVYQWEEDKQEAEPEPEPAPQTKPEKQTKPKPAPAKDKPKKKPAKSQTKTRPESAINTICSMVCADPTVTKEQVEKELKSRNQKASEFYLNIVYQIAKRVVKMERDK